MEGRPQPAVRNMRRVGHRPPARGIGTVKHGRGWTWRHVARGASAGPGGASGGTRVAPSWASRGTVGEQMQRWALTDGAKGKMVFSHLS